MIRFKEKIYGKKDVIGYIKKHPTLPISAAALGVSGASLSVSERNRREGREDRRE